MMRDFIQLNEDNILRIGIKDKNGNPTGKYLEFDLEDVELPLRLNQCESEHRNNLNYLKMQSIAIDKRQDVKGKYLLTKNEKDKLLLLKDFYKKEIKALDLFLGEGGTDKLLNGRKPYYSMYDDISKMLEPVMPMLNLKADDIMNKIKAKYSNNKEEDVLE